MQDIVIYGAGGFGREVRVLLDQINAVSQSWNIIGFLDDHIDREVVDDLPVIRTLEKILKDRQQLAVVIAIADPSLRRKIKDSLVDSIFTFPTIIHPQANIGDKKRNTIGEGCIITAGCILTTGIQLQDFCIVNLATTIGHDVSIGRFTTIMPGCNLSGFVRIDEATLIGTGVQILQNLSIGKHCKVGAGAVVTKSIPDNSTAVGIPARAVKQQ